MPPSNQYPQIGIRSKNELAKRISSANLSYKQALYLINDVLENFDKYWHDSPASNPMQGKFVRSAAHNPLGKLLRLIDKRILSPHDSKIPEFIFGGLSKRSHIQAAYSLRGKESNRKLLKLDIKRFFEGISEERVIQLFQRKCACSRNGARLLARICCVPVGAKGCGSESKSLARGFATSPRLSLWCNLGTFMRIHWAVLRKLRGHDARLAIFVDDIGITASRISEKELDVISSQLEKMLLEFDPHQPLPLNLSKKRIMVQGQMEHLGLRIGRRRVTLGSKARSRMDKLKSQLSQSLSSQDRSKLKNKLRSYRIYNHQVAIAKPKNS